MINDLCLNFSCHRCHRYYLTISKSKATMAASILSKSRHLSFNSNFVNVLNRLRYSTRPDLKSGPGLKEFLIAGKNLPTAKLDNYNNSVPYLLSNQFNGNGRKVFFEIYGCQMNTNDGEVVYSVLKSSGYVKVDSINEADVVLLITCSIRDRPETKVSLLIWKALTLKVAGLHILSRI